MSRFARSCKNCDFLCVCEKNHKKRKVSRFFESHLRFFAVICHVDDHLSPDRVADLTKFAKNRKSNDFLPHLLFFAVLCHQIKPGFHMIATITAITGMETTLQRSSRSAEIEERFI